MSNALSKGARMRQQERLYKVVLSMICPKVLDEIGETPVRGLLDQILTSGKVDGRITVYSEPEAAADDRLIDFWQDIVAYPLPVRPVATCRAEVGR